MSFVFVIFWFVHKLGTPQSPLRYMSVTFKSPQHTIS